MSLGTSYTIPNTTITPDMHTNGTAQNQVLLTGVTPFAPTYQTLNTSYITESTNLYYTSARAITDAKTAISPTDSAEIDFTYTSGNIIASLINASIANGKLANSSITLGSTAISLGSTSRTIGGLSGLTLTSGTLTKPTISATTINFPNASIPIQNIGGGTIGQVIMFGALNNGTPADRINVSNIPNDQRNIKFY